MKNISKPKIIRFFDAGGHDAGTGLYKDTPGIDMLIIDKSRLAVLTSIDGPSKGASAPMASLNKLRSPYGGANEIH